MRALLVLTSLCAGCVQVEDAQLGVLPTSPVPPSGTVAAANVKPVIFGADVSDVRFVFVEGPNTITVPFERVTPVLDETAYLLDPPELPPGALLEITSICAGCGLGGRWPRANDPDVTPPLFADGPIEISATGFNYEAPEVTHYGISVLMPPIDDVVVLRFTGDEVDVVLAQPQSIEWPFHFNVLGGEARTTCFTVFAIDAAGNETALGEELCAELDPEVNSSSCAHADMDTSALALLGGLAWAAHARRNRRGWPRRRPEGVRHELSRRGARRGR